MTEILKYSGELLFSQNQQNLVTFEHLCMQPVFRENEIILSYTLAAILNRKSLGYR